MVELQCAVCKLVCVFVLLLQVVEKLIRGLAMEESKNLFNLFEHNACTDRALESRVIVADVLAKFERYLSFYVYCCRLFGGLDCHIV